MHAGAKANMTQKVAFARDCRQGQRASQVWGSIGHRKRKKNLEYLT